MITDPPLLKIRAGFPRPSAETVRQFSGAMTGHLVDAMGGSGALDWRIKPLAGRPQAFCGVAVTCDCGPSDNLALFGGLDVVKPGDVLMAATGGYMAAAVTGDLLAGMAKNCGAAALVTDGVVRDVAGLLDVGLPVYCAGVSANSPARNGPGTVGLPVMIGGVSVSPGDIVVGDGDGAVVVPLSQVDQVLARLVRIRAAEAALEAKVKAGLRIPEFITSILSSNRVERLG
ncbi:RraA family protein [Aestuariivirga sp.]|uniref:RraA family protein n=1 Tax=Aestuariivirga sp. TaxID=2650926 RepID=UPI0039E2FC14